MEECATSHENCPGFSYWADSQLPTRVIYVGSDDREVRLFLSSGMNDINHGNATRGYTALSYVWGMDQDFKTTKENVNTRYQSLDVKCLPTTIQDAISVTRSLQIPYLWVDSLCIIQDLPTDVSNEISKMAQIYKSAIVTISAAKANNCEEGFLEPRQRISSILASSLQIPFRLPSQALQDLSQDPSRKERFMSRLGGLIKKNQSVSFGEISLCADMSCGHDISMANGHNVIEPITGRAWTLQESWLSARVLIYGEGPLRMKCLNGEKIDGYEFGRSQLYSFIIDDRFHFFPRKDNVPNGIRQGPNAIQSDQSMIKWNTGRDMIKIWISLVGEYSKRKLSEPNDKLRALSGLATEFYNISHDDFYAGIWKTKMTEQLLWYQIDDDPPRGLPSSYRAPSWSWASVEGKVTFSVFGSISFASTYDAPKPTPVTIISCSTIVTNPIERFGEVVAGELVLSAPAKRMSSNEIQ
jgi:Heterokaryon incompatibility protein (HET)